MPSIKNNLYRKCGHHDKSERYMENVKQYKSIMTTDEKFITATNMNNTITTPIVFHFIASPNTYDKALMLSRANEIVASINEDFNNYSTNFNSMNNYKYRNIVNTVFLNYQDKQNIYLSTAYTKKIPANASNIVFELNDMIFYNVNGALNLIQYDDVDQVELEYQVIKQYIQTNKAQAIQPENLLNIWVIDMVNTAILGFSNFPWEPIDNYHGIVISRRIFEPEFYKETNYSRFKTLTHEVGHYFGMLHIFSNGYDEGFYSDPKNRIGGGDYIADTPTQTQPTYDPTDKATNNGLLTDASYNPLFMDFMDYTYDKYVAIFTSDQIIKMRYMIYKYRNQMTKTQQINPVSQSAKVREAKSIPSLFNKPNPRTSANGSSEEARTSPNTQSTTQQNQTVSSQASYLEYMTKFQQPTNYQQSNYQQSNYQKDVSNIQQKYPNYYQQYYPQQMYQQNAEQMQQNPAMQQNPMFYYQPYFQPNYYQQNQSDPMIQQNYYQQQNIPTDPMIIQPNYYQQPGINQQSYNNLVNMNKKKL